MLALSSGRQKDWRHPQRLIQSYMLSASLSHWPDPSYMKSRATHDCRIVGSSKPKEVTTDAQSIGTCPLSTLAFKTYKVPCATHSHLTYTL